MFVTDEVPKDEADEVVDTTLEVRGDEDRDEAVDEDEAEEPEGDEDGEEEGDEPEDEPELPRGVQRRFAKLTKRRKEAEARVKALEAENAALRERSGDAKLYFAAAKRHGILPELLDARTVKGLDDLSETEETLESLRDVLDDMEDSGENEMSLGGKTVTMGQVRKQVRALEKKRNGLREEFGEVPRELGRRVAKLLKLGLAAEKAAGAKKREKRLREEAEDVDEVRGAKRDGQKGRKRQLLGVERGERVRGGGFKDPEGAMDRILSSFV